MKTAFGMLECNCFFEWVLGNQIEDELPSLLPEATLAATETGVVNLSTVYLNWKKARSTPTPHQSFIQACALTVISRFPSSQTTYPLFHLCHHSSSDTPQEQSTAKTERFSSLYDIYDAFFDLYLCVLRLTKNVFDL